MDCYHLSRLVWLIGLEYRKFGNYMLFDLGGLMNLLAHDILVVELFFKSFTVIECVNQLMNAISVI